MNKGILRLVRNDFNGEVSKKRNFANIRKFFDMSEKDKYTLDDQTWEDLDMDRVYEKLDRTYSSAGEAALYSMLRNPLMNEENLKKRHRLIRVFEDNNKLRDNIMSIFFNLSKDNKNNFLDMIDNDLVINKFKYYLYTFLGKIVPVIFILLAIFMDIKFMILLFGVTFLNIFINFNERGTVKSNGIVYLRKVIKTAKKISSINNEDIIYHKDKISSLLKDVKDIDRDTRLIELINMWGGFFESLAVIFLLEECTYYSISEKIKHNKETLMELYYAIGELEALISISGYQHNLDIKYSKPNFIDNVALKIYEGIHPLIEGAVSNSISIENKGIVLTGTNMSGKSTFLRMLGINILLAQTFYFVLAKEYKASFFNIVSSISPNDDLAKGKSFYMAEAEAILRIINALEKDIPVFCPIDEIFRGTNPVERISMSAEILTYINKGKSISIVATHDRELVDILKDNYEFYYFSEEVDTKKGLSFDYKIKKGTSQTRNAIRLLEYIGYPKGIVDKSYERAKSIEGFL